MLAATFNQYLLVILSNRGRTKSIKIKIDDNAHYRAGALPLSIQCRLLRNLPTFLGDR